MKLRKVTIKNNWESYEYFVDGKKINPRDIKEIYDNKGVKYEVTHRTLTVSYSDHGHTYNAHRVVFCVAHSLGEIILDTKSDFYIE